MLCFFCLAGNNCQFIVFLVKHFLASAVNSQNMLIRKAKLSQKMLALVGIGPDLQEVYSQFSSGACRAVVYRSNYNCTNIHMYQCTKIFTCFKICNIEQLTVKGAAWLVKMFRTQAIVSSINSGSQSGRHNSQERCWHTNFSQGVVTEDTINFICQGRHCNFHQKKRKTL